MRRVSWIALVFLGFATLSVAQQSTADSGSGTQQTISMIPEADRASKDQLLKLFDAMRLRTQIETVLNSYPQALQQQMKGMIDELEANAPGGAKLTAEEKENINKVVSKYMEEALRLYPVDEMVSDMVPVYQEYLTREDVDAILAFYQSPAGQHFLEKQPAMMQAIMALSMNKMQERSKALIGKMMKEMMETAPHIAPPPTN